MADKIRTDMADEIRATDILIPIMGPTGSGKSSFINSATSSHTMRVGKDIYSCTSELSPIVLQPTPSYPSVDGHRVLLVDTPGFDDTYEDDFEILEKIATWLQKSLKKGAYLGGVIYLHDISVDRLTGMARRNLKIFQSLCGDEALKNVALVTSKWDRNSENAEMRQKQLEESAWENLIHHGAQTYRTGLGGSNCTEVLTPWRVIDQMFATAEKRRLLTFILQVQDEMANKDRIIPETEAAKTLRRMLEQALEFQKKFISSSSPGSDEDRADIQKAHALSRQITPQLRKLKIPISRRFKRFLGLLR